MRDYYQDGAAQAVPGNCYVDGPKVSRPFSEAVERQQKAWGAFEAALSELSDRLGPALGPPPPTPPSSAKELGAYESAIEAPINAATRGLDASAERVRDLISRLRL